MRIATSLLAATALSLAALMPVPVTAETALCNGPCLLTGGERGDYYQYFAPPLSKLLQKAWADAPIATSPGAPASLAWVVGHPDSYALIQGDVLARALKDAAVAGKIKVIRSSGIGNEAVFAIMNDKIFERSSGSWGAVARHAKQVRFATASRESGPGATMQALQALDPDNLGKANVTYYASMDAAIKAVQDGEQDVALMVQFANPENPRFEAIKAAHLHFAPVLMPAMKSLTFPDGSPAYTLCENVQTGAGTIDTACTPIQFVTGAANDNADLTRVFGAATEADFMPHQSGFARFWKSMKVATKNAASSAFDAADRLAKSVSDRM